MGFPICAAIHTNVVGFTVNLMAVVFMLMYWLALRGLERCSVLLILRGSRFGLAEAPDIRYGFSAKDFLCLFSAILSPENEALQTRNF